LGFTQEKRRKKIKTQRRKDTKEKKDMKQEELTNNSQGKNRRKGEGYKTMNNQIYEDYKQELINNVMDKVEQELNKRTVTQLEVIVKGEKG